MSKRTASRDNGRYENIVNSALRDSELILNALSDRQAKKRATYARIHAISGQLLSDRKNFIRPDAANLEKYARIGGMSFPTARTLINWYRDMIAIWVRAHRDLVALRMEDALSVINERKSRNIQVDAQVQSLQDINRVLYLENCELRARLSNKRPDISAAGNPESFHEKSTDTGVEYVDLRPLRTWLESLDRESSYLEITKVGLKISRRARFGVTIMTNEVHQLLKSL